MRNIKNATLTEIQSHLFRIEYENGEVDTYELRVSAFTVEGNQVEYWGQVVDFGKEQPKWRLLDATTREEAIQALKEEIKKKY